MDSIVAYWTHAADFCNTIPLKADIHQRGLHVRLVLQQTLRDSSSESSMRLCGRRLQKVINEGGESVPISELAVMSGARGAAGLKNDEFDDLLLEVIVFGEA